MTLLYNVITTNSIKEICYLQTEGVWSTGVIPRGTRFGPFEGTRTPNKPNDKVSWRYYWRVSTQNAKGRAEEGITVTNDKLTGHDRVTARAVNYF